MDSVDDDERMSRALALMIAIVFLALPFVAGLGLGYWMGCNP